MDAIEPNRVERVILVVIDGVRADAVPLFDLTTLAWLAREGAATFEARTVQPAVTAAAMGSLFTGLHPRDHGLDGDRFRIPRPRQRLEPLPLLLREHGVPTHAFLARVPRAYRTLASHFARSLGVAEATFSGERSTEILTAALPALARHDRGLFFLHFPDADRAGHADGWNSRAYVAALRDIDHSLSVLDTLTGASGDDRTLLIAVADHGGGGVAANDHDSGHRHDCTIPLVIAGGAVRRGPLPPDASLLDVPATVLWAFGVPVPSAYAGRPLREVFETGERGTRRGALVTTTGVPHDVPGAAWWA